MDWNSNSKWDWEHSDSPKKMGQLADWMIVYGGEMNPGAYNSGGSYTYAAGHNSSASASTDSSTRDFRFNLSKQMEYSGNSPSMEASSVGSGEPLIGLKLGKRTYFENNTTFTVMPTPSCTTLKKFNKSSSQNASVCCQVEGCNVDLSGAKDYHRKHRVCDIHSKFPKVIVGGLERRFCQQCSRFHSLCEFDEKKRSCRRRLSNHNARRRKPQPETIQFNSTRRLSSPFYGGTQQMGFLLNNDPHVDNSGTPPAHSIWDRVSNRKFTLTKGYPLKSNGDTVTDGGQLCASQIKLRHPINVPNGANGLLATKNCTPEVFNPGLSPIALGSRGSLVFSSSPGAAPYRALSLLSSNSWDSCEPEPIPLHNLMHASDSNITHSMVHAIPEAVPLSSAEFWLNGQQSMHSNIQSLAGSSNFQEFQLFKSPYEADFYPGILN